MCSSDLLRAPSREQRHAQVARHRLLDALEARERNHDVDGQMVLLEELQHPVAHVRRVVVGNDRLLAALGERDRLGPSQLVARRHEHHEFVGAEDDGAQARL